MVGAVAGTHDHGAYAAGLPQLLCRLRASEHAACALEVLVRPVPEPMSEHFTVGYVMWSAAVILARWLHRHPRTMAGKRVLEIGAGLGLGGLVAAQACFFF